MIRSQRRIRALAVGLSMLAGYVDAIGFISLGGYFVSFMSGNSTRLAVGAVRGMPSPVIAMVLITTFVLGVMLGSVTVRLARGRAAVAVLCLVCFLLAFAALCGLNGMPTGAVIAMTLAMGAENTIFERDGEVHIGLTYMTGTLVKLGQRITGALFGGDRFAWISYLLLWMGLVAGACIAAFLYPHFGWAALWFAAAAAAVLAVIASAIIPATRTA
jgi:uncharacterized membrane protein YoaK (UPF0700 family)